MHHLYTYCEGWTFRAYLSASQLPSLSSLCDEHSGFLAPKNVESERDIAGQMIKAIYGSALASGVVLRRVDGQD